MDGERSHEHLDRQGIADPREQARPDQAEMHQLRAERRSRLARETYLKAKSANLKRQVAKLTAQAERLGLLGEATEAD
ncbi:MAG: hypothetical protein M0Z42_23425 [Actinomycetota bacterium]|nr:hypothetical protein [Actinomycetota bacterium]